MSTRASPNNAPIGEANAHALANAFVAMPGIVVSYDSATKTVTVQPVSNRPLDDEDGIVTWVEWPEIQNVPVGFFGSAEFSIVCELAPGDAVWLVFADYSFADWRRTGKVSDAGDTRNHGPSYPIAFPWYRPGGKAGSDATNSLGSPGGSARVYFDDAAFVRVGGGASAVARADLVDARLDALEDFAGSHTHPYVDSPVGAAVTSAATGAPTGTSTAASKLKTD